MNEFIQAGVIGAGGISNQHLKAMQKEPRVHVKSSKGKHRIGFVE